jgi:murein L,D-transpeptidase YafK
VKIRRLFKVFILLITLIIILMAGLIIARSYQTPPLVNLNNAYKSINRAKMAGAAKYAPDIIKKAENLLLSGERDLSNENKRIFSLPSYDSAISLFSQATILAEEASKTSKTKQEDIERRIKKSFDEINSRWEKSRKVSNSNLTAVDSRKLYSRIQTNVDMAQDLISQDQHLKAESYIKKADSLLDLLSHKNEDQQNHRARFSNQWSLWVNETIQDSKRTGNLAIVVDKEAHKLFVVKAGKIVSWYPCSLGYNSAYQKLRAGDGATPEGKYRITQVKHASKYYKALLLDYPNHSDKIRFAENKRKGVISKNSHIGGLIEIHGGGVSDSDWTDGCIALENEHMDRLLRDARVGTPVAIVQSSHIGSGK